MAEKTRTFHAQCLCKSSSLSFTIPTSSLPVPTHFCHCSICRHTHGTLATIHTPIPAPKVALDTFTAYPSSDRVARYFCSTCGAHMLDKATESYGEQWYVATSLVDAEEEVWAFGKHVNVESTVDGGLASWLSEIDGKRLEAWKEKDGDVLEHSFGDWKAPTTTITPAPSSDPPATEKLHAHCHCNGVSFYIHPPRDDSVFENVQDTLTPEAKNKWYALNCLCTSCRLASGCASMPWAFPLMDHITLFDDSPYPLTHIFGSIKEYRSSDGVLRTFCGTCGAVVAYACDDRPGMVDIAVGLLDARDGALANSWLEWRVGRCGYGEDCRWSGVLASLTKGTLKWANTDMA